MGFLQRFRLRFLPPKLQDPDFGQLLFMEAKDARLSYWECEWKFPPTGTIISIGLSGDKLGPRPDSRQFYLALPGRFDKILELARPVLADVFRAWLDQSLPQDIFTVVNLAGFDLKEARATPVEWDISFETLGEKWLGITIPFVGNAPGEPTVDT